VSLATAASARQQAPKTTSDIYNVIMQELRDGVFAPGRQLPNERQMAERHGTTRQRIRDAMLIMQEAGLIKRRVGSGTYLAEDAPQIIERMDAEVDVRSIHDHSFLETIEARLIIEPGVAALAARNITDSKKVALKEALDDILRPCTWIEFKSRLYLFTRSCYEASGNSFLLRTFDQILKARQDHKFDGHRENGAVADIVRRHSHEQLQEIYKAISTGDEQAAERVTRNYLVRIAASSGLT
jgi:GntR family transcriptional regulator, transcriptional repressor for pyruvate dehydrogenase complex